MRIKTNYHTHISLCNHAVGNAIDYVETAIKYGYELIGISDHAPVPKKDFPIEDYKRLFGDQNMSLETFYDDYLVQLDNINTDDIIVKKGLESEYIDGNDDFYRELLSKVDYMILGVHFFKVENKFIDSYLEINKEYMYEYAKNIDKALSTGMFKILAHPDLYLVGLDSFDEDCKEVANMIIDSCIKHDVYLEINCNGRPGKYPYYDFYKEVVGKPVKLIVGVDAHAPERLKGKHIDKVYDLIDELGLTVEDRIEL